MVCDKHLFAFGSLGGLCIVDAVRGCIADEQHDDVPCLADVGVDELETVCTVLPILRSLRFLFGLVCTLWLLTIRFEQALEVLYSSTEVAERRSLIRAGSFGHWHLRELEIRRWKVLSSGISSPTTPLSGDSNLLHAIGLDHRPPFVSEHIHRKSKHDSGPVFSHSPIFQAQSLPPQAPRLQLGITCNGIPFHSYNVYPILPSSAPLVLCLFPSLHLSD